MSTQAKSKRGQTIVAFRSDCSTQRVRYYHGMLLREQEFIDDQRYHYDQQRHANSVLHGTGIVDGLVVGVDPERNRLKIGRGSAIDDCGRVIQVCEDIELCISNLPKLDLGEAPCHCDEREEEEDAEVSAYKWLVLCHAEREVDPRPAYRTDADCTESKPCEFSRIEEGFEIKLIDTDTPVPYDCAAEDAADDDLGKHICSDGKTERFTQKDGWPGICGRTLPPSSPCPGCCKSCGCSCIVLGLVKLWADACGNVTKLCYWPERRRNALGLGLLREVYMELHARIATLESELAKVIVETIKEKVPEDELSEKLEKRTKAFDEAAKKVSTKANVKKKTSSRSKS
jgi:hypothetical protein